jgi:flagellar hook assembly protein FlgD
VATDPTAPFGVTVSTIGLANGTHQVSAQVCNTAGTACDTGHPAAARTITVKALRPVITSIGPSPFSPNRDGRRETTRVAYRLDQTQTVVLRVRTSGGSTVFGPKTLGTNLSAGSRTYTWSGKNNKGVRVGSRTYTVLLSTSRTLSGITLAGRAGRTVRVDVGRPGLGNITDSPSTFYPYQDGYRDRTKLSVTFSEPLSVLNVHVYNRSGTRVRTVNAGPRSRAGRTSVFWNGRYSSGTMVRAGRYYYRFVARDKAGNQTTSARYAVDVIR